MKLSVIVAVAENWVIGRDNALIWRLSADLKRFKSITSGHTVLMGRKTFDSLGRALPNRRNVVITRNDCLSCEGVEFVQSIDAALALLKDEDEVFIIGGGSIYKEMLNNADNLYLTVVHTEPKGDTYFPEIDDSWKEISRESYKADEKNEFDYEFVNYIRNMV